MSSDSCWDTSGNIWGEKDLMEMNGTDRKVMLIAVVLTLFGPRSSVGRCGDGERSAGGEKDKKNLVMFRERRSGKLGRG